MTHNPSLGKPTRYATCYGHGWLRTDALCPTCWWFDLWQEVWR